MLSIHLIKCVPLINLDTDEKVAHAYCMFYGMVAASIINSWILYNENQKRTDGNQMIRCQYSICRRWQWNLSCDGQKRRYATLERNTPPKTWSRTYATSQYLAGIKEASQVQGYGRQQQGFHDTVALCDRTSDIKTRHRCQGCGRPVCLRHIYV